MKIHVSHDGEKFGPYEERIARSMYLEGRIARTALVWHEGLADWQPASQVFGEAPSIPPSAVPPPIAMPVSPSRTMAGDAFRAVPPRLHWALVLLFSVITFGIFAIVWFFIQASWIKKIDPRSQATPYLIGQLVLAVIGAVMGESDAAGVNALGAVLTLGSYVLFYCAYYSMRRSMLDHFNNVEPIGLRLSGFMTFFFSMLYLQHHMTRIADWRTTGTLVPQ